MKIAPTTTLETARRPGLDRGWDGLLRRPPTVNHESELDFLSGFRQWIHQELRPAAQRRVAEIIEAEGLTDVPDLPLGELVSLLERDPLLMTHVHHWERSQSLKFQYLSDTFHRHADFFLSELAAAERAGPGSLSLAPDLEIPRYAALEIHLMPGGYVADPFAGHYYYHSCNVTFPWAGGNRQDQAQQRIAQAMPQPADGKVSRILEQGTSCGQLVLALKRRFPTAEVWGNDVGAPMLRFAHLRSVQLGVATHYVQELAEASGFENESFDIVTNNLLFHEVPADRAHAIVRETFRLLRPGGVYFPVDVYTGMKPFQDPFLRFAEWWNHRWNNERWLLEYRDLDLAGAMRSAGFVVDENGPAARRDLQHNLVGYKPL
jgi:ubiquinone/menaquinone biosynthesis C-methylase UbiE